MEWELPAAMPPGGGALWGSGPAPDLPPPPASARLPSRARSPACALKCMGGHIQGRLWPRDDTERRKAQERGYDLNKILTMDDLVSEGGVCGGCSFFYQGVGA